MLSDPESIKRYLKMDIGEEEKIKLRADLVRSKNKLLFNANGIRNTQNIQAASYSFQKAIY
jgi:hypothetical protein